MKGNYENLDGVEKDLSFSSNLVHKKDNHIDENNKGTFYALTIKPSYRSYMHTIGKDKDVFESWYRKYCHDKDILSIHHVYEENTQGVLHIHSIIFVPLRNDYKVYNKGLEVRGMHIWLVKRKNQRWEYYMHKIEDNTTVTEFYRKNYGFVLGFD